MSKVVPIDEEGERKFASEISTWNSPLENVSNSVKKPGVDSNATQSSTSANKFDFSSINGWDKYKENYSKKFMEHRALEFLRNLTFGIVFSVVHTLRTRYFLLGVMLLFVSLNRWTLPALGASLVLDMAVSFIVCSWSDIVSVLKYFFGQFVKCLCCQSKSEEERRELKKKGKLYEEEIFRFSTPFEILVDRENLYENKYFKYCQVIWLFVIVVICVAFNLVNGFLTDKRQIECLFAADPPQGAFLNESGWYYDEFGEGDPVDIIYEQPYGEPRVLIPRPPVTPEDVYFDGMYYNDTINGTIFLGVEGLHVFTLPLLNIYHTADPHVNFTRCVFVSTDFIDFYKGLYIGISQVVAIFLAILAYDSASCPSYSNQIETLKKYRISLPKFNIGWKTLLTAPSSEILAQLVMVLNYISHLDDEKKLDIEKLKSVESVSHLDFTFIEGLTPIERGFLEYFFIDQPKKDSKSRAFSIGFPAACRNRCRACAKKKKRKRVKNCAACDREEISCKKCSKKLGENSHAPFVKCQESKCDYIACFSCHEKHEHYKLDTYTGVPNLVPQFWRDHIHSILHEKRQCSKCEEVGENMEHFHIAVERRGKHAGRSFLFCVGCVKSLFELHGVKFLERYLLYYQKSEDSEPLDFVQSFGKKLCDHIPGLTSEEGSRNGSHLISFNHVIRSELIQRKLCQRQFESYCCSRCGENVQKKCFIIEPSSEESVCMCVECFSILEVRKGRLDFEMCDWDAKKLQEVKAYIISDNIFSGEGSYTGYFRKKSVGKKRKKYRFAHMDRVLPFYEKFLNKDLGAVLMKTINFFLVYLDVVAHLPLYPGFWLARRIGGLSGSIMRALTYVFSLLFCPLSMVTFVIMKTVGAYLHIVFLLILFAVASALFYVLSIIVFFLINESFFNFFRFFKFPHLQGNAKYFDYQFWERKYFFLRWGTVVLTLVVFYILFMIFFFIVYVKSKELATKIQKLSLEKESKEEKENPTSFNEIIARMLKWRILEWVIFPVIIVVSFVVLSPLMLVLLLVFVLFAPFIFLITFCFDIDSEITETVTNGMKEMINRACCLCRIDCCGKTEKVNILSFEEDCKEMAENLLGMVVEKGKEKGKEPESSTEVIEIEGKEIEEEKDEGVDTVEEEMHQNRKSLALAAIREKTINGVFERWQNTFFLNYLLKLAIEVSGNEKDIEKSEKLLEDTGINESETRIALANLGRSLMKDIFATFPRIEFEEYFVRILSKVFNSLSAIPKKVTEKIKDLKNLDIIQNASEFLVEGDVSGGYIPLEEVNKISK